MNVLGIDPGQSEGAYCLIEHAGTRARWLDHGAFPMTPAGAGEILQWTTPALVVIERPTWIVIPFRFDGRPLVDTAWHGGGVFYLAASKYPTTSLLMRDVRGLLCGRTKVARMDGRVANVTAGDAQVKAALAGRVDGIPTRTSNHHRDACAVAYVGGLHWMNEQRKGGPNVPTGV